MKSREEFDKDKLQGISDGFGLVATIGGTTGNLSVEKIGMAGVAAAQGVMGIGALTGTMGMTAVTGLAMITPITAVIGAGLALGSLGLGFGKGNKQGKAMQKAFKQISKQLVTLHRDMYRGFNALNDNTMRAFDLLDNNIALRFDQTNEILMTGLTDIYNGISHINNHINNLDENISKLQLFLQKSLQIILSHQEVLFDSLVEGMKFLDLKLNDQSMQLSIIDQKLNQISAQLQTLGMDNNQHDRIKLLQLVERYGIHQNPLDYTKAMQAISKQLALASNSMKCLTDQGNDLPGWYHISSLSELFKHPKFHRFHIDLSNVVNLDWAEPAIHGFCQMIPFLKDNDNHQTQGVLNNIATTAKATADFLRTITKDDFLKSFFEFYTDKLAAIQSNADKILKPFRNYYSQYAKNSLTEKVQKHNNLIKAFKFHANILATLFKNDERVINFLKNKFSTLHPIKEDYSDIKFSKCMISTYDISNLQSILAESAEDAIDQLDSLTMFVELKQTPTSQKLFKKLEEIPAMKSISRPEDLDKILKEMEPVFKVADNVKGQSMVYVMGITGGGKSTLINHLNGSRYTKGRVRGKPTPIWDANSTPEICTVGESLNSMTLCPQPIPVKTESNESILYCDLPGLNGTRERTITVTEAYAPYILNEQIATIEGIVWVVNANHFDAGRGNAIKEMLSNFIALSKGNPDVISDAITIVITKDINGMTQDEVIENFEAAIDSIPDKMESELLAKILARIKLNNEKIIISNIYATDNSHINAIHTSVKNTKTIDKDLLDFSHYCKEQRDFVISLNNVLEERSLFINEFETCKTSLANAEAYASEMRNMKESSLALIDEYHTKLNELTRRKNALVDDSQSYQSAIDAVINDNEKVLIDKYHQQIEPETTTINVNVATGLKIANPNDQSHIEHVRTDKIPRQELQNVLTNYYPATAGQYLSPRRRSMQKFKSDNEAQGFTVTQVYQPNGSGFIRYTATKNIYKTVYDDKPIYEPRPDMIDEIISVPKTIPFPAGNIAQFAITYPADHPIMAEVLNATGWTIVPGTERSENGYHATVSYERGVGCHIQLGLRVAKKDSPDGRAFIQSRTAEKNTIDAELAIVSHQIINLESSLNHETARLVQFDAQLPNIENHKNQLREKMQEMQIYMQENQLYFDSLDKMQAIVSQQKNNHHPAHENTHASLAENPASLFNQQRGLSGSASAQQSLKI